MGLYDGLRASLHPEHAPRDDALALHGHDEALERHVDEGARAAPVEQRALQDALGPGPEGGDAVCAQLGDAGGGLARERR